jgi:Zinc finger, C3HC4 type (RING finger)
MSCPRCPGCRYSQPNQMAHMDPDGCLFVAHEESVWETDSEPEDEEEEPSFIAQMAASIRSDQNVALAEGAERLLDMDFGEDDESEYAEPSASKKEPEPQSEKPQLFEAPIPLGECPICYEDLKMIDFTVTKCGHTFHSSCLFRAMEQNLDCPMCRCQLLEVREDDEDDENEDGEEEEDEDDEEEDDEEEREDEEFKVTLEQLCEKMQNMGYSPIDFLSYIMRGDLKSQNEARQTEEFLQEMGDKMWGLICGNISLATRDQRTYAQVAAKPPQQLQLPQQVQPQPVQV